MPVAQPPNPHHHHNRNPIPQRIHRQVERVEMAPWDKQPMALVEQGEPRAYGKRRHAGSDGPLPHRRLRCERDGQAERPVLHGMRPVADPDAKSEARRRVVESRNPTKQTIQALSCYANSPHLSSKMLCRFFHAPASTFVLESR